MSGGRIVMTISDQYGMLSHQDATVAVDELSSPAEKPIVFHHREPSIDGR
jgi:hypothetical protein